MNFPFFIANRYLVKKKSRNVVNIISYISVIGIVVGTMALVIVLSVFNGFDSLLQKIFSNFDPEVKISLVEGKTFTPDSSIIDFLDNSPEIATYSITIEDNALARYNQAQIPCILKGVDESYARVTNIDSMIYTGDYILKKNDSYFAIPGLGIASQLEIGLNFLNPLVIVAPKRGPVNLANPAQSIQTKSLYPSGIFSIQQEVDFEYIIVPIEFARDVFELEDEITQIEIKVREGTDIDSFKEKLSENLGDKYKIQDRYEQHAFFYKMVNNEKLATFLILAFILIISSFNIIAFIAMLIAEKKEDIKTLRNLGAELRQVRKVFLYHGWLISIAGALIGILTGSALSLGQQHFGWLKLQGSGSFIIDAYPVVLKAGDIGFVLITVIVIGFLASYYPVRFITRRYSDR